MYLKHSIYDIIRQWLRTIYPPPTFRNVPTPLTSRLFWHVKTYSGYVPNKSVLDSAFLVDKKSIQKQPRRFVNVTDFARKQLWTQVIYWELKRWQLCYLQQLAPNALFQHWPTPSHQVFEWIDTPGHALRTNLQGLATKILYMTRDHCINISD